MSKTILALCGAAVFASACVVDERIDSTELSTLVEQDQCGFTGTAVLSNGLPVASMVVSNDADNLYIHLQAPEGLFIHTVWLYAGMGPVPANSSGVVWPEFFPYSVFFDAPLPTEHTFVLPLAELGVDAETCGSLTIAAWVKLREFDDKGQVLRNYWGWAYGDTTFVHGTFGTGTAFDYQPCCEPPPPPEDEGCTLTMGYWKTHNEYGKRKLAIDWPAPYDELDLLCGETLLDILNAQPQGDAWYILAHQYIAASLNIASGATTTAQVDEAFADGEQFLLDNCGGVPASEAPQATNWATILDLYNNGDLGPGHCD